jgi:hypothetical protein
LGSAAGKGMSGRHNPPSRFLERPLTLQRGTIWQMLPTERVVPALLTLLASESALVREGAIYGLAHHDRPEVVQRLGKIATDDPSPGVRAAAADVLETR